MKHKATIVITIESGSDENWDDITKVGDMIRNGSLQREMMYGSSVDVRNPKEKPMFKVKATYHEE